MRDTRRILLRLGRLDLPEKNQGNWTLGRIQTEGVSISTALRVACEFTEHESSRFLGSRAEARDEQTILFFKLCSPTSRSRLRYPRPRVSTCKWTKEGESRRFEETWPIAFVTVTNIKPLCGECG